MSSAPVSMLKLTLKPTKNNFIRLIPLGCLHVGHRNFLLDYAKGFIEYALRTPDTYIVSMGDTVENVTRDSIGSPFEQTLPPSEQVEAVCRMFEPLVRAGKILFMMDSNHSYRSIKTADYSPEADIARRLGVPYGGWDLQTEFIVGKQHYFGHFVHGGRGTASPEGALASCKRQATRAEADLYVRGHHHTIVVHKDMHMGRDGQLRKRVFAVTGCFLGWKGSYAEVKEYPINAPGTSKIKLYADKWDIHANV